MRLAALRETWSKVARAVGLAGLATLPLAGAPAVTAQVGPGPVPRFGIAHVDLLDLHLERQPGAPARSVERLSAAELAERYRRARELGGGWHRWSLNHDLVEADGFRWEVPDGILARDVAAGLRTLAVLQGPPLDGLAAPVFRQADGRLTDDPTAAVAINPDNPWARFVSAVVQRYRPGGELARERGWSSSTGITAWEVGNEPNNAHFWSGSVEAYVRFLEVSYLVIHYHDPPAIVLHGGIGDGAHALEWYDRFAAELAAKAQRSPSVARHSFYFDRMAWHWYTSPVYLVGKPAAARAILQAHSIPPKPLWVTELGLPVWSEYPGPCWDAASPGRGTLAEQAAFLWEAVSEGLAQGVEVVIVFQLYDDCGNGEHSYDALGLVRNHEGNQCWAPIANQGCWRFEPQLAGVPRPAFESWRLLTDLLGKAAVTARLAAGDMQRVVFRVPPDGVITVAWNTSRGDRTAVLPATGRSAVLYRMEATGLLVRSEIAAQGGSYRVVLPPATNRNGPGGRPLVHGRPVVVVERGVASGAGREPPALPGDRTAAVGGVAPGADSGAQPSGADTTPPVLAVVRELPAASPPKFELEILAADERALDAYVVYYASDRLPSTPSGWIPLGPPRSWPGKPRVGVQKVPFEGLPGRTYFFTAQAGDTGGNWTPLTPYAQAATTIVLPKAMATSLRSAKPPTSAVRRAGPTKTAGRAGRQPTAGPSPRGGSQRP